MVINSDKDIRGILDGIRGLTLPKREWTHEAHFAAALAILSNSKFEAFNDMPLIIRSYNEATGIRNTESEGYHHTITIASLLATQAILAERYSSLTAALKRVMASEYGSSDWVLDYWSKGVLFSIEARKSWVVPDIKSLPFPTKKA